MAVKKPDKSEAKGVPGVGDRSPLAALAGSFLIAAALFTVATVVTVGVGGFRNPYAWGAGGAALVLTALWYAGTRQGRGERDQFGRQRLLQGSNAFVSLLLFAALMVGVNYLATRRHRTFDLTSNKVNTLAEQTRKVLDNFKDPVELTYIYSVDKNRPTMDPAHNALVRAFGNASDKVKTRFVDARKEPDEIKALNLGPTARVPMVLISVGDSKKGGAAPRRQEVTTVDEQNLTSALIKLNEAKASTLYLLGGHGELTPGMSGDPMDGISQLLAALEAQNYVIETLTLGQAGAKIPEGAAAVMALGPRVDLLPGEEKLLKQYVAGKGRLLVFLNTKQVAPRWKSLLKAMGVEAMAGRVWDPAQNLGNSPELLFSMIENPERHAVLRGVDGLVVFPSCVPLHKAASAPPDLTITPLFESSSQSMIAPTSASQKTTPGPFVLAAAIEKGSAEGPGASPGGAATGLRAVVCSSSALATDYYMGNGTGNLSFLQSAVNWVVGSDTLVSIPPKAPVTNTLTLAGNALRLVGWSLIFVLPTVVLLFGTIIWWRRR